MSTEPGEGHLERTFSYEAIAQRREQRHKRENPRRGPRRVRRARELREVRKGVAPLVWPRDEVLAWAKLRPEWMSSDEAEAVLLGAVFFYDTESTPNPGLPETLQRIPVGRVDPPGEDPNWLIGRQVVVATHGYDRAILDVARVAASRIEARSPGLSQTPDAPPAVATAPPSDTERNILDELREVPEGRGLTAKQLGEKCHRSEDAVGRAVRKLRAKGYCITNGRNRVGYVLEREEPRG